MLASRMEYLILVVWVLLWLFDNVGKRNPVEIKAECRQGMRYLSDCWTLLFDMEEITFNTIFSWNCSLQAVLTRKLQSPCAPDPVLGRRNDNPLVLPM